MQISRHWRMNSQRYRLEGVRYTNGAVSLQARPARVEDEVEHATKRDEKSAEKSPAIVAA